MYDRLIKLIGEANYNKLKNKTVAVIGLGGVGGAVCECLARSGIGKLIIVDFDTIGISNLNRQIITNKTNIGCKKTEEMRKRIELISETKIIILDTFLGEDNLNDLFKYDIDYLIDACDSIKTKKALIKRCTEEKIPFISCMGTGNKLDPLKYEIVDIRKTSYDPIAKILRKYVKDMRITERVMVLYSKEEAKKVTGSISSIAYMPTIAGNLCASYVIRKILEND